MKVCIVSQNELKGTSLRSARRVKDDFILGSIRKVKQFLRIAQNNELYVSKKHLAEYLEKRKKYEKRAGLFSAIAVIVVIVLIGLPLLSGIFDIVNVIAALFLGLLLITFALLPNYTPALEGKV
ncbi:MAG TPA: hypothetical protein VI912_03635 [Candidatus Bilamarchaeaceae archaeon]|nr:hypothetical protein [Candidatus Bilamarchaeaceae archaeon]